jgi:hypothetical protein
VSRPLLSFSVARANFAGPFRAVVLPFGTCERLGLRGRGSWMRGRSKLHRAEGASQF